jgi:hypothetical protein
VHIGRWCLCFSSNVFKLLFYSLYWADVDFSLRLYSLRLQCKRLNIGARMPAAFILVPWIPQSDPRAIFYREKEEGKGNWRSNQGARSRCMSLGPEELPPSRAKASSAISWQGRPSGNSSGLRIVAADDRSQLGKRRNLRVNWLSGVAVHSHVSPANRRLLAAQRAGISNHLVRIGHISGNQVPPANKAFIPSDYHIKFLFRAPPRQRSSFTPSDPALSS